ncbi:MAG: HAMP domain-containing protein [Chloroflexi bacterium]|nr:HAMP domain-containing protein [Chloroflexota bacterium]
MTLRVKTLLAIGLTITTLIGLIYGVLSNIIQDSFTELESQRAVLNGQRVVRALQESLNSQLSSTSDYAQWDDTYLYTIQPDPAYIENNYDASLYPRIGISLIVILGIDDGIVFAEMYDHETGELVNIPATLLPFLEAGSPIFDLEDNADSVTGILLLPEGPLLVTSHYVLDNAGESAPNGYFLMARWLDDELVSDLAERTSLNLKLHNTATLPVPQQNVWEQMTLATENVPATDLLFLTPTDQTSLTYLLLRDLSGNPALLLEINQVRDIYQQGQSSLSLVLLALVGIGLAFGGLTLLLLERLVVSPVALLSGRVSEITATRDLTRRLPVRGTDELANLTERFNELLAALLLTQRELEHAKETAEEANRAKSQFLANMSHELRTPLGAIMGYADLIHEALEDEDYEGVAVDAQRINVAGGHLLNLINSVLDLAKVESGRMSINKEPIYVPTLLEEVLITMRPLARKNGNQLQLLCAPQLGWLETDPVKLKQILVNLIGNASKFTIDGDIVVQASQEGEKVQIAIRDTGVGIPPVQQERIFHAFVQADESTTRQYGGTGLGLTISQHFAHLLGGDIQLVSELGRGSTFTLTLPIVPLS